MSDFYIEAVAGNTTPLTKVIHKFGRNAAVGATMVPVALGGTFRTPLVSAATKLRVKAGNVADTAAGAGARAITLEGIDADGYAISETIATAGASAGADTFYTYIRLLRAYVSSSGTYGTATAGSHAAAIVIENAAGTENWMTIGVDEFPRGQSESAIYTVPLGKMAYISALHFTVDTTKTTNIILFARSGILQTVAPFRAIRQVFALSGIGVSASEDFKFPLGPFEGLTDIGIMANVSSTTSTVVADFEILEREQE